MSKLSPNANPDDMVRTTRSVFVTTKTEADDHHTEVVPSHEAAGSDSEVLSTHESGSTSSHD
jgi:hypothetical protein